MACCDLVAPFGGAHAKQCLVLVLFKGSNFGGKDNKGKGNFGGGGGGKGKGNFGGGNKGGGGGGNKKR
jgi:hypothetical protein